MATVDKTWVFAANTEGLVDVGDSAISVAWDSTPQALEFLGAASGTSERARRAATGETWQTWGVPAGATVTDVQVISWNSRRFAAAVTATVAMRVVGSGGTTVHSAGDLVSQALTAATDGSPVAQGSGTSRAVDGGSQASTTDVRLEIQLTLASANINYDLDIDNVLLRITYTTSGQGGPSSATVRFATAAAGRKTALATASATVKLGTAATGRKTALATAAATLRMITAAAGGAIRGAASAGALRFLTAAAGTKTGQAAAAAQLRLQDVAAGFKTGLSSHQEASASPPFTVDVPGTNDRIVFTTTATGVQATIRGGPSSGTLRLLAAAAGRKTALGAAQGTLKAQAAATGTKTALSPSQALTRFLTAATGTGATIHQGPGSATLRFLTTATGRKTGVGQAATSIRFQAAVTGRKTGRGAATSSLRLITTASTSGPLIPTLLFPLRLQATGADTTLVAIGADTTLGLG